MIPRRLKIALLLLSGMVLFMGLYALRLKHEVDVNQRQAADARPLTPLLAGSSQNVVLYIANDDDGRLHRKDLALPLPTEPNARARQVLRALLAQYSDRDSRHPLDSGSEVTAVFVVNGSLAVRKGEGRVGASALPLRNDDRDFQRF